MTAVLDPHLVRQPNLNHRNRHEDLLTDGLATRFHAALIVAFAGPTEARFEQVVRRERREARGQRARAAGQDPHDGPQIVIRDARRDRREVRERPDVTVEKADLILTLVDPGEVTAGVHQPHQEEPRLAVLVDVGGTSRRCRFHSATVARLVGARRAHLSSEDSRG